MKGLTRRNLGLAAVGGALGGKQAFRDVGKAIGDGVALRSVPHPVDYGEAQATTEGIEAQRARLLDRKATYERWARGEFEDGEVGATPIHDAGQQAIFQMKSLSPAGRAHMLYNLQLRRERAAMQKHALHELLDIEHLLKKLAGLG
ncbi:MAG TPA: hypothetical protein VFH51_15645 [Myxococcota bacterium]|nr:hypothetical protein [Myxococcota bacterium]